MTYTKLTTNTEYRMGYGIVLNIEIVAVSVDESGSGYNCWGYRLGTEMSIPGALHFDSTWTTPGDALNAAHRERTNRIE